MKYSNKTKYTDQQIKNSLLDLMKEKPFEQITVDDISDNIHINRSTFYRHMTDKYEVLDMIENEILDELDEIRNVQKDSSYQGNYFEDEFNLISNHRPTLKILLGNHPSPTFSSRLETRFTNDLMDGLKTRSSDMAKVKFVVYLEGSVSLNMFKYVVLNEDDDKLSHEQISEMMLKLGQKGPIQTLEE